MNNMEFEKVIDYSFKDKLNLETALTHSSYCREHDMEAKQDNERLEFLGDAFFDAVISVCLYNKLADVSEGKLTKTRALIVCEASLAKVGLKLKIGEYLRMGKGEEQSGGRTRESIVADAVEAVVGAIILDGGYAEAERFILREFETTIEDALKGKLFADYKTELQEELQKKGSKVVITYVHDSESGPDHDKTFFVHVECNGVDLGSGKGKSKKEAEQKAAKAALEGGKI